MFAARARGRNVNLTRPEIIVDPTCSFVPIRLIGRLVNVTEFLRMRPEPAQNQRSLLKTSISPGNVELAAKGC
jgi:hypothetical protein